MARRELGDLRAACVDLERAWETAAALDDLVLAGRIATTLSLVVAYQGELANALAILDVSEPEMGGAALGHSHLQRGIILYQQGELDAALAEYEAALEVLADAADELGETRVHVNLGALFSSSAAWPRRASISSKPSSSPSARPDLAGGDRPSEPGPRRVAGR